MSAADQPTDRIERAIRELCAALLEKAAERAMPEEEKLGRLSDAFSFLDVGKSKGYELLRQGRIPGAIKIGDCWRVRMSVLRLSVAEGAHDEQT